MPYNTFLFVFAYITMTKQVISFSWLSKKRNIRRNIRSAQRERERKILKIDKAKFKTHTRAHKNQIGFKNDEDDDESNIFSSYSSANPDKEDDDVFFLLLMIFK